MQNRYEFLKEFCPALDKLADYANAELKMNHAYLDDVVFEIKIHGCQKPLLNKAIGTLERRKQITDFQDNHIDLLLESLDREVEAIIGN